MRFFSGRVSWIFFIGGMVWVMCAETPAQEGPAPLARLHAAGGIYQPGEAIALEVGLEEMPENSDGLVVIVRDVDNALVCSRLHPVSAEERRVKRAEVTLAPLPPGYYSLGLRWSGREELPEECAAFVKVAVIAGSAEARMESNVASPFGADAFLAWRCGAQAERERGASAMRRAGIAWSRDRLSWAETQPEAGPPRWGKYDESLRAQAEAGLRILQVFHDIPEWASSRGADWPGSRRHVAPADFRSTVEYFEAAARQWRGVITAWELWNEFDLPVFFQGTPDEYASVLRAAALGIRRGDPEAILISGSTTLAVIPELVWGEHRFSGVNGLRFVERLLCCDVEDCFDAWTFHYYGPPDGLAERIAQNRALLRARGINKPLWLTEIGLPATPAMKEKVVEEERRQAVYLVKSFAIALAEGVEKIFFFSFPDFLEHGVSAWGIAEYRAASEVWLPKPALAAYGHLMTWLDGYRAAERFRSADGRIELCRFSIGETRADESCVILAWRRSEGAEATLLDPPRDGWPGAIKLFDLYGREKSARGGDMLPDGLALSAEPIILVGPPMEFPSLVMLGRHVPGEAGAAATSRTRAQPRSVWADVATSSTELDFADRRIEGRIRVNNADAKPARVRLIADCVSGADADFGAFPTSHGGLATPEFMISPFSYIDFPLGIPLEDSMLPAGGGALAVRVGLRFAEADRPPARTARIFDRLRPFEFRRPDLISPEDFLDTQSEKPWTIRMVSRTRASGDLVVETGPVDWAEAIAPAENRDTLPITRTLPLPEKGWEAEVALHPLRQVAVSRQGTSGSSAPAREWWVRGTFEGHIEEYRTRPEVAGIAPAGRSDLFPPWVMTPSRETLMVGAERMDKVGEMRAEIRPSWTSDSLRLEVRIWDKTLMNPRRATHPWEGDAFEVFLDVREGENLGRPAYETGVFQIIVVPPDSLHPQATLSVIQPAGLPFARLRFEAQVHDSKDGWTGIIELAWADLGVENARAGRELGIEFALDDLDPDDWSHRQMVWRGTGNNFRDPSVFPRVRLWGGE